MATDTTPRRYTDPKKQPLNLSTPTGRAPKQEEQDASLPDSLRYDETVLEYIEAQKKGEDERLPEPPRDHLERDRREHQVYMVHDPARDSFELDHNAPLETPMERELHASMDEEVAARSAELPSPQDPVFPHMKSEEDDMSAAEMIQDDWISEEDLLEMAQIEEDLDPTKE